MSNKALNAVLAHSETRGVARMVLFCIADRANDAGFAWCGVSDIAARAGIARKNVPRILASLVAGGELTVEPRAGKYGCNAYQISPALLARAPQVEADPLADPLKVRDPQGEDSFMVSPRCPQEESPCPQGESKCPQAEDYTINTPKNPYEPYCSTEEINLTSLQSNPAYRSLDVPIEKLKAEAWISVHPGRKLTQSFLVNWLNRAAATQPRKLKFQL